MPDTIARPFPPRSMGAFEPAPEIWEWCKDALISSDSPIYNPNHGHLEDANIGCLWTSVYHERKMKQVLAMCEIPMVMGNKWLKSRMEMQLEDWFGEVPDFLITFYAPHAQSISNDEWCCLAEHELLHAGHQLDKYGMPMFSKEGRPKYGIRDHDGSFFLDEARRWGTHAMGSAAREFVEYANRPPEIAQVDIKSMCGTCLRKAA